jgi:hypothetical protein
MERWVVKWPQTPIPGHTLRSGVPKKAPDIGLTLTAKIPFAVNLSWRTPSILGVDERTVGRDKDAGNPADERPDPLLFKVPAIPAD